jgi:hypothetical protein
MLNAMRLLTPLTKKNFLASHTLEYAGVLPEWLFRIG